MALATHSIIMTHCLSGGPETWSHMMIKRNWGRDGSVAMLASRAWRSDFGTHAKSDIIRCICIPVTRWQEKTGRSSDAHGSAGWVNTAVNSKRSHLKQGRRKQGVGCPVTSTHKPSDLHMCVPWHADAHPPLHKPRHIHTQMKPLADLIPYSLKLFVRISKLIKGNYCSILHRATQTKEGEIPCTWKHTPAQTLDSQSYPE